MPERLSSLSELIRDQMRELGIRTQADLARVSGLSTQDINRFFGGGTKLPGPEKRRLLAKALEVSHLDLLVAAGEITREELGTSTGIVERTPDDPRELLANRVRGIRLDYDRLATINAILEQWNLNDRRS